MRVAAVDSWGCATSWWLRLLSEGVDVNVYVDPDSHNQTVGDGLVPKETSYDRLVAWAHERPAETIVLFCQSKYGEKAEALRKDGLYVVGGGAFEDKLETDRQFGQDLARAAGCNVPAFKAFRSCSEGIDFYRNQREGGCFKTDEYLESDATQVCKSAQQLVEYLKHLRERYRDRLKFIVQEVIGGKGSVDIDINRWWNGREFVGPYGMTLEHKRFMAGELGPSTGCAVNCFWWDEGPELAETVHFENFAPLFTSMDATPGIYALNFRISDDDGQPYFLEWTPRLGFDSEPTAALLYGSLAEFLWCVGTGQGGTTLSYDLAFSTRLTVPPYPYETVHADEEHTAKGIPLPNDLGDLHSPPFLAYQVAREDGEGLYVASAEGIVGLAAAVGDNLASMGAAVNEFIHELHGDVSKIQARLDGAEVFAEDARKLDALYVDVHPAILGESAYASAS